MPNVSELARVEHENLEFYRERAVNLNLSKAQREAHLAHVRALEARLGVEPADLVHEAEDRNCEVTPTPVDRFTFSKRERQLLVNALRRSQSDPYAPKGQARQLQALIDVLTIY